MTRTELLNFLIDILDYKTYLEIGVQNPYNNFHKINVSNKIGVEPYPKATFTGLLECDSDYFFTINYSAKLKFDLIFIDGDHRYGQCVRDAMNSLEVLADGGTIVMHDINPTSEDMQADEMPSQTARWCGGAWKVFAEMRMTRPDLFMVSVLEDHGCGIIQKSENETLYPITELTYDFFDKNKNELMNTISWKSFQNFFIQTKKLYDCIEANTLADKLL